jgi:S-adenosylmethionine/arginine decarboxylase-like enzyme
MEILAPRITDKFHGLGIVVVINVYDCRREKSRKIARVEKTLREVASFDMIRVAERLAGNGPPQ